jgi:hypothetical protein
VRLWGVAFTALLLALPAAAREDFTERNSCKGYWTDFTDGDIETAKLDACDGVNQDGDDPVSWNPAVEPPSVGTIVDDGDVPPGSRPGADSLHHEDINNAGVGAVPGIVTAYNDFTFLGWWKQDVHGGTEIYVRRGGVLFNDADWFLWCNAILGLRFTVSGTNQIATWGRPCITNWVFLAGRYDGDVNDEIETHSSQSSVARSLLDCGGGVQSCNTNATGPKAADTTLAFNSNELAGLDYEGNTAFFAYFGEALSEEEICQNCRCGTPANLRGVGRTAECNRCALPSYQTCRRLID